MLSTSESRVYPYQRLSSIPTTCDFCGSLGVQQYKFDFEIDCLERPARYLLACSSHECQEKLDASIVSFNKNEGRIPLQRIQRSVPGFFALQFSIRRTSGEEDEGWTLPLAWAARAELSTLQKLRGEPWWRVILQKGEQIRHTMLHEIHALNKDKLDEEEWNALFALLPPKEDQPNDTFKEFYDASVWSLDAPTDADLLKLRTAP
jgi:hypothetical protein